MNFKVIIKLFITILMVMGTFLVGCGTNMAVQDTRGLFSWKDSEVLNGSPQLFTVMKDLKLNTLYQGFSKELREEDIRVFLGKAASKKIDVYLLAGAPEWALQEGGESACLTVEKALKINSGLEKNQGLKGVVFDVEPYLLKDWDKQNYQGIMDRFIRGMKAAYEKARENGLEVIVCVPYFYDDLGLSSQLEDLIKSCSDGTAVMNYNQGKEYKHIKTEAELTTKYRKKLISIYELQAPGKDGLTDKNTYYEEGIGAAKENFAELKQALHRQDISIAFHEYQALKELTGLE